MTNEYIAAKLKSILESMEFAPPENMILHFNRLRELIDDLENDVGEDADVEHADRSAEVTREP
jgi:hypothetical protein